MDLNHHYLTPSRNKFLNDKGELEGFEVDVWKEIAKRNDCEVTFEQMPFSSLLGMVSDGRVDTVANTLAPTEKRKEVYNFSEPYLYDEQNLMSSPSIQARTFKDLDGLRIGLVFILKLMKMTRQRNRFM